MIAIIISACLTAQPTVCKDHKVPLNGEMDLKQCTMYAPPYFAQWAEEHPAWTIKRWKCQPASLNDI
jgi:hypothetical protein